MHYLIKFTSFLLFSIALVGCNNLERLNRIELTEFRADGTDMYISGEINALTLEQFNNFMVAHPNTTRMVFGIIPGSIDDETNIKLGYEVRRLGLATHLTQSSEIYSGGVDLFLAGKKRTIESGAVIGVHSWADGLGREGKDVPASSPQHQLYLDYYRTMGIDDSFYWFTLEAASADDIHLMTEAEIKQYGFVTR